MSIPNKTREVNFKLFAILFVLTNALFAQENYRNNSFEFERIDKPLLGDYKFNELLVDYTINLPALFSDSTKLPKSCRGEIEFYTEYILSLPEINWDFIKLEKGGVLTIKQGYRWDGATNLKVDKKHNHRSSMIHDVFYDLMRLEYLDRDYYDIGDPKRQDNTGDYNRKVADMLYYFFAREDGLSELIADLEYAVIRNSGRIGTVLESRLKPWKFHVSGLSAIYDHAGVRLNWLNPDIFNTSPGKIEQTGYALYRNGVFYAHIAKDENSFVDKNIEKDKSYTYQLVPVDSSVGKYNWSNRIEVKINNN